jgi:hypothetical protein
VSRYWDRISRPEQLPSALLAAMRVLTDPAETGAVTLALPRTCRPRPTTGRSSSEGIRFYTRAKAITSRWSDHEYQEHHRTHMHFPTAV